MFDMSDPKYADMLKLFAAQFIWTAEELAASIQKCLVRDAAIFNEYKISEADGNELLEGSFCHLIAYLLYDIAKAIGMPFEDAIKLVAAKCPEVAKDRQAKAISEKMN